MANSGKVTSGPYWTQNWIEAMWRFTSERFVNFDTGVVDYEALGREEYEFRKALFYRNFKNSPRAKTVFDEAAADYNKKVQNGKNGGRPRNNNGDADTREGSDESASVSRNIGNDQGIEALVSQGRAGADSVRGTPLHSAPARSPARKFRNKEEYMQWAIDSGLDATDASECWDATLERGGKDADGNVVKNIKAFAKRWCRTRAENRRKTA